MVKYLNNRRTKSRSNRQQPGSDGQQAQGQQAQSPDNSGGTSLQDVTTGGQGVLMQDHPAKALISTMWNMGKKVLIYQPREKDDTFSLGGRRTGANGSDQMPPPDQGQLTQGQSQQQPQQGGQQPQQGGQQPQQGGQQPQQGGQQPQQGGQQPQQGRQQPQQGGQQPQQGGQQPQQGGQQPQQGGQQPQQSSGSGKPSSIKQNTGQKQGGKLPPKKTGTYFQDNPPDLYDQFRQVHHTQQGGTPPGQQPIPLEDQVHYALEKNLEHIKRIIHYPDNKGFTIREFKVGFKPPCPAFIVFTEGLADKNVIDNFLLEPLMVLGGILEHTPQYSPIGLVKERLVTTNQVEEERSFRKVMDSVLMGSTAIFVEGSNSALLVETKGWEHRPIGQPIVENVVRGPQEGFNEVLISNIALVRSRLRTENLVSEMLKVGRLSKADVSIMYLRDVANPAIVEEVRKRINGIDVDYVPDTGMLEQFIEDNSFSPMPQILATERPDRVAAYLAEGHVAIIMSSTPFALIVPVTFWALLHSAEDFYVRWPYGSLMRMVRVAAVLIGMFLPAVYIAIVNYHHAMVPQDLLFAIAASREQVPFPAVVEVIIMELAFELIREAGIRIPSIIGPTIGIVGALILGQAAVQANLITPLVIIIVALTGLSSFAIPNYNLSFQVRIIRFIYIGLAAVGGFVTMSAFMVVHMAILTTSKSFGVPILSPAAPNRPSNDTVMRGVLYAQEKRPSLVRPLKQRRQPPVSRAWNPAAWSNRGEGDQNE